MMGRAARDRIAAERRAAGLCWCGRKPAKGRSKCERCLEGNAIRERQRRRKAREEGRCTVCKDAEADLGCRTCCRCRRWNASRARTRRMR